MCYKKFIQGTALKAHQKQSGHAAENPCNPNQLSAISVNNPNRIDITKGGKQWKIEPFDEKNIRAVKLKRGRVPKNKTKDDEKLEDLKIKNEPEVEVTAVDELTEIVQTSNTNSNIQQIVEETPSASYGFTVLPNGKLLMTEIYQITPQ